MSGFFNDHQIPAVLAKCIENGLQVSEHVRASVLPHPSLLSVRLVQVDCQPMHDRHISLSFGIDWDYDLVPEEVVPIQALDLSGSWADRNRKMIAYHSWATDDTKEYPSHNPPTKRSTAIRKSERDPQVVLLVLRTIISQIMVVPNPKIEMAAATIRPEVEAIGQVAIFSAD